MTQKIYQVDAFAAEVFSGNPAAVCPLDRWLRTELMQKIAGENNLSETVFFVKNGKTYDIRWFTPTVEVDLCGHATLAAAFVLFEYEGHKDDTIHFYSSRSGGLSVVKNGAMLTLNFPTDEILEMTITPELSTGFDIIPEAIFKGKTDYLFIYATEEDIKNIIPAYDSIRKWPVRGVIVTAPGINTDFVSRFFGPQTGVNEDPVTGSAHTTLTPYWANRLNKNEMTAAQLSDRGGFLKCTYLDERVAISGFAKLYLKGEIYFEDEQ
jgi:PhzF family phenazine biosynthesis protein